MSVTATKPPLTTRITRAIDAVVIRPARQNPTAFVAIAIAIVALLAVARITQIQSQPTATPIATQSTSADSMTSDTGFFASDFSRDDTTLARWEQNETGAERRIVDDGEYLLSNSVPGIAMTALYDSAYRFADATITLEGNLDSSSEDPNSAYGIVFRYQDADNYNVFAVDGMGRYSIWVRENGVWLELRNAGENWTEDAAIQRMGETNSLTLNIAGNTLIGLVNSVEIVTVENATFADGGVGIYMATASGGSASAAIDRYVVETLVSSEDGSQTDGMTDGMTNSMTDNESMTNDTQAEETEEP